MVNEMLQQAPPARRIALGLEYLGTDYHGWQRQRSLCSVQGSLEAALSQIANHPVEVTCAGRTDRGVHASGQVVHFDTTAQRREAAWILGCNTILPASVRVQWACPVAADFSARFSAVSRRYRYVVYNREINSALFANLATWHYRRLDAEKMQEAADYLLGEQDFTSLRSTECQASTPIKTIEFARLTRTRDFVILDIKASGFLHHMVRNIMGVLLPIGEGKHPPARMAEVIAARNRSAAGVTALPNGLYLVEVGYPAKYNLPKRSIGPDILRI